MMHDLAGRQHSGPLVGREEELRELSAHFEMIEGLTGQEVHTNRFDVLARRPYGVFLLGEAGIGKTRLAEEMASRAQLRGWAVIWHRAYAQEQVVPYWLWSTVLRTCLRLDLWRLEEEEVPARFLPLIRLLPELADRWPADASLLAASSEQEPFLMWEATLAVFKSMCRQAPVLLVIDDAHWADEGSGKLLGYLLRRLLGMRVLILCTCRQEELTGCPLAPLIWHLQRERLLTMLHVRALPNEQIYRMLAAFHAHFSPAVIQRIQRQAAGNPFFAEELARSVSIDKHSRLPQSITSALSLRLERLSPACQRFLSKAAVLGSAFDINLISVLEESLSTTNRREKRLTTSGELNDKPDCNYDQMVPTAVDASTHASKSGQSPVVANEHLFDLLEEAVQAGILTETNIGARVTYSFWHPLMVTHLYESLSAARRIKLHGHVAKVLQQVYADRLDEQAAIITHHLLQANAGMQDIMYYAELAGNHAYALFSYPEAEKYYRIVLECLTSGTSAESDGSYSWKQTTNRTEDTINQPLRSSSVYNQLARKIELLELLGECTSIQGNYEEARRLYEQALHLRQQQLIAEDSEEYQYEAQMQALLWCEIGRTWYDAGQNDRARACYCRAEEILYDAHVVGGTAWGYVRHRQSYISWREANYDAARVLAYEALSLFEKGLEPLDRGNLNCSTLIKRIFVGDPVILARIHGLLGLIANGDGRPIEALQQYTMALDLHELYGGKRDIAVTCCNMGDLQLRRADYVSAQAFFQRSLHMAEQVGESPLVAFNFGNLGQLEMRRGALIKAENELRRGIAQAEHVNASLYLSMWCAYLSSILLDQGRIAEAGHVLYRAWKLGRAKRIPPYIGQAQLVLGQMRIAQAVLIGCEVYEDGSNQGKQRFLTRAKKILLRTVVMKGLEAETRTEGRVALAQAILLLGDMQQAQSVAMRALEEARQGELRWLVARAQRVLGSIYAAQKQTEQALCCFEQALGVFRETGMRLEYARTLQQYGEMLMQREGDEEKAAYQRGLEYLREARDMFEECGAQLELSVISKSIK